MTAPARTRPPKPPEPIAEEVRVAVNYLSGLTDDKFSNALADAIMHDPERYPDEVDDLYGQNSPDPIPVSAALAAFRGPDLIRRSYPSTKYLIDFTHVVIKHAPPQDGLTAKKARMFREQFINRVGRERGTLKIALDGWYAQKGIVRSAPNPKARAARELRQLHLREYQKLVRKYEGVIKEAKAETRRVGKATGKRRAACHTNPELPSYPATKTSTSTSKAKATAPRQALAQKPIDVPRTGTGNVIVPKLDLPRITAASLALVQATLLGVSGDKSRLACAARIQHEAGVVIDNKQEHLYDLGVSIALFDGGRAVYDGMGITRSFFTLLTNKALGVWPERKSATPDEVRARALARKVKYYRNAVNDLPSIAEEVESAKARIAAAMPIRDAMMIALKDQGLLRREIAEIAGCAPSRVSHIIGRDQ